MTAASSTRSAIARIARQACRHGAVTPLQLPLEPPAPQDMFNGAAAFNADLSSWTVGSVTDMQAHIPAVCSASFHICHLLSLSVPFYSGHSYRDNFGDFSFFVFRILSLLNSKSCNFKAGFADPPLQSFLQIFPIQVFLGDILRGKFKMFRQK